MIENDSDISGFLQRSQQKWRVLAQIWVGKVFHFCCVCRNHSGFIFASLSLSMVLPCAGASTWRGCKTLYAKAGCGPKDLGQYHYVRCNPVACRLVLIKKRSQGRHRTTVHGKVTRSAHSLKQAKAQKEPWLLAVSPQLAALTAKRVG